MKNTGLATVIVSGGYSSRMGGFKPFMQFGGKTAVEMLVDTYKKAGIDNIIVVTGYRGGEVAESLEGSGAICVQNQDYAQGMFTSVVKGIQALDAGVSAFFMQPVDIPLIKKHTIEVLANKYKESGKSIIYPQFCGQVGHPPLIDCRYKDAILSSDGDGGLKRILRGYACDSISIPVFDRSILMDMDTPEDYEMLLDYFNADAPDMDECCGILDSYKVDEKIIRHGRKVSEVALEILHSLDSAGYDLNERVLKAAAVLHDMARKEKNHARVGEKILQEIGYDKVASIIGSHMDIEVNYADKITEGEILYLADKLIREDEKISLEDRFQPSINRYQDDPEVLSKILNRKDAAFLIIKKIENAAGRCFIHG